MKEVEDILNAIVDEAEKNVSDCTNGEKQVVLDDMFASLLNSWVKATSGRDD